MPVRAARSNSPTTIEQLRDLAQDHRERDAVHIAIADRLREELGDEPEARESGRNAHDAGHDRHRPARAERTVGITGGYRQDDRENHGRQRRVRSEDENAARTEQGIREQRHDRRVETGDARQS
jgi:hypothetical protein